MAFSFLNRQPKRREHVVAFDLGTKATKAVYLQAKADGYCFANYTVQQLPALDKGPIRELLAEHFKQVYQTLGCRTRQVVLALGTSESLLRLLDMPMIPVADLRKMLKLNPKNYLQQELTDYVFDCFVLGPNLSAPTPPSPAPNPKEAAKSPAKCRVIVGGAKRQVVEDCQAAAKAAGLTADVVTPNLVGPGNALELADPEVFRKEVIAAVDLGFRTSSISIVYNGELALNRVVPMGGDKLTSGLAEVMNISYAEAEGIKVGMPQEVETALQPLLAPLGRELRVSIDFFEHQNDKTVSQVFVSGAAAQSNFILQALQSELLVPCKNWNPTSPFELTLPAEARAQLDQVAPQLAVAIGAAATAF